MGVGFVYRYTAQRVIARPTAEVFGYLADATRQTEWVHGVSRCSWLGDGPAPGAVAEQTMTFLGKTRTVPMTVVEYQPERRVVFEKQEPMYIRFGFELEEDGGSTLVRYPVEMGLRGVLGLLVRLVGHKEIEGDLTRIAQRLETP